MAIKTLFLTLLLLSATAVLSQDTSGLPACAQNCLASATSTCAEGDLACLCADTAFFGQVQVCVVSTCTLEEITPTLAWYSETCPAPSKRALFGRNH